MRDDFGALFAASAALRRDPIASELTGGIPCGPFSQQLLNELFFAESSMLSELAALSKAAGIAPDETLVGQIAQAVARGLWVGPLTGTGDLAVATLAVVIPDFRQGMRIAGVVTSTNTVTTPKLRVTNLGAAGVYQDFPIVKEDGTALSAGDLKTGRRYRFEADGAGNVNVSFDAAAAIQNSLTTLQVVGGRFAELSGAGTWTVPAGVTAIRLRMNGGGGGGGGCYTAGSFPAAGSGGGGGEYAEAVLATTPGQALAYSVGLGGSGGLGSSTPTAGATGNSTTFGGLLSALGGGAGSAGLNGIVGSSGAGGTGGSGAGVRRSGRGGGYGIQLTGGIQGGQGGDSPFAGPGTSPNVNSNGTSGNGPGGGGAGGAATSNALSGNGAGGSNGGTGAAGYLRIDY